ARKTRYADWDELIGYCALSAMPVGRYVLDVHGEDRRTWAASDALCAALQIINHLQDCAKDFRTINRVYLPSETLARHGAGVEDLGAAAASPALLAVLRELNEGCARLLRESAAFPAQIADRRLALEVAVIHSLAESLVQKLRSRDPLSERVHATKPEALLAAGSGIVRTIIQRMGGRRPRAQAGLVP
ncbi:MAG: hpnC, partial [Enterovirga sp.]|nr:hpnC [Enterovirga sp.]